MSAHPKRHVKDEALTVPVPSPAFVTVAIPKDKMQRPKKKIKNLRIIRFSQKTK